MRCTDKPSSTTTIYLKMLNPHHWPITISNFHTWYSEKNLVLEVYEDKLVWLERRVEGPTLDDINTSTPIGFGCPKVLGDTVIDTTNDVAGFIRSLDYTFQWTGGFGPLLVMTPCFVDTWNIEHVTALSDDLIKHIYSLPIGKDVQFVHLSSCSCQYAPNEGCSERFSLSAIYNSKMDLDTLKGKATYGDMCKILGFEACKPEDESYFCVCEYPDSVILSLELATVDHFSGLSPCRCRCHRLELAELPKFSDLDPECIPVVWSYGR